MSDVIDIRPDTASERLIDPNYIECRIDQLIRECEKEGIPCIVTLLIDNNAHIRANHTAFDQPLTMSGMLDVAKDAMRGIGMEYEEVDDDEGEPSA